MCGISGIVSFQGLGEAADRIEAMVAALRHRGPDGCGILKVGRNAVLGHTRLAIVDLQSGAQPMRSPDGHVAVTFNGEIYGYRRLRHQLDYPFITESDTEVLLALFQKSGPEMLRSLPGMFSFAIWDEREQSLFCARDRFGEKPFYYALTARGDFLFASEIKAILASGLIEPVLDLESVGHYLQKSYVHPHRTIYTNISAMPPGHSLVYCKGQVSVRKYWEFPKIRRDMGLPEAIEQLDVLLRKAIKTQLVADVPVSGFLSSGLDSTTIMALAAEENSNLKAFSFDFQDENSEANIAERSAKKYGLHFQRLQIGSFDPAEVLLQTIPIYDEPFADSSSIPTYLISKAAAQFTKVALTGDGGDELLAGYDYCYRPLLRFDEAKSFEKYRFAIQLLAKILWKAKASQSALRLFDLNNKIKQFQGVSSKWEALGEQRTVFTSEQLEKIFKASLETKQSQPPPSFQSHGELEEMFFYDIETFMSGQVLVKTDRASMANGLELRAPFLDVEFAEFALSIPARLKIDECETKIPLRRAYENCWLEEVRSGAKRGFESPIEKWLQRPSFVNLCEEYLENRSRKIHSLLEWPLPINKARPQHIYSLLVLSLWMEKNSYSLP